MNEASGCIQAQIRGREFGHQGGDNRFSALTRQLFKADRAANRIGQSSPSLSV